MKTELVEKVSKDGNKYICLEVHLTPTYTKLVFLNSAEKEIINNLLAQQSGKA